MVKHVGLTIQNNRVREKPLIFKVRAGLQFVEVLTDSLEVVGLAELINGFGEGDSIDVTIGSERSGAANFEYAFGILLGFEKLECGFGFLDGSERLGRVWR